VLRTAPIESDATSAVSPIPAEYPRLGNLLDALAKMEGSGAPVIVRSIDNTESHLVLGVGDESLCRGRGGVLEWVPRDVQDKPSSWVSNLGL